MIKRMQLTRICFADVASFSERTLGYFILIDKYFNNTLHLS